MRNIGLFVGAMFYVPLVYGLQKIAHPIELLSEKFGISLLRACFSILHFYGI